MTTDQRTMPCPDCQTPFVVGAQRCLACELPLLGPTAAELWRVDQQLEALGERRRALIDAMRHGGSPWAVVQVPVGADPTAPARRPVAPATQRPVVPSRPDRADATPQQLLLVIGVVLLLVAGAVFVAVAWRTLGVWGQFALLLAVIAACVASSVAASRRRLNASAEAFALLAGGLSLVAVIAAYELDFAGLGGLNASMYAAGTLAVLAFGAFGANRFIPRVRAYPVIALVSAWAAVLAACGVSNPTRGSVGLLLGGVLLASPALAVVRRAPYAVDVADVEDRSRTPVSPWARWAPLWPPAGLSVVSALALATLLVGGADGADAVVSGLVVVALSLGIIGHALGAHRTLEAGDRGAWAFVVWVVAGAEVALALRNIGPDAVLAGVGAATLLFLMVLAARSPRTAGWSPQAAGALCGFIAAGVALVTAEGGERATASVFVLLTVAAVAVAVTEPALRVGAELVASGAALVALGLGVVAADADEVAAAVAFALAGLMFAGVAGWRMRHDVGEEFALVGAAACALVVSAALAFEARVPTQLDAYTVSTPLPNSSAVLSGVLALFAAVAFAYAFRPGRGLAAVIGAPLAVAAIWTLLLGRDVEVVETYSLTAAAVCAVVGLVVHLRERSASSWLTSGAASALALLPSTFVLWDDESVLRFVLVLTASGAVLLAGVATRQQAPIVVATISLVTLAIIQLGPFVAGLPQWLTFGTVGLVLVLAGVRYERTRRDLQSAGDWFAALN